MRVRAKQLAYPMCEEVKLRVTTLMPDALLDVCIRSDATTPKLCLNIAVHTRGV
jgi:hypothetical protein